MAKYVVVYDNGTSTEWASNPQDTPEKAIALAKSNGVYTLENVQCFDGKYTFPQWHTLEESERLARSSNVGWLAELNDDEAKPDLYQMPEVRWRNP